MAIVTKTYNPADVFQGPADIYLNVTAPPSAVPPVQGTNTLVLDANGQPQIASTGQLATVAVNAGGTNYAVGDDLTIVQGGASSGIVRVKTISAGAVTAVVIVKDGTGYATGTGLATTGGSGSGATININSITAGYHLGLTEGPAQTNFTPKFNMIHADQFAAAIDAAFVSFAGEIDFIVKEYQLKLMERLCSGIFTATYFDLPAGTNPAADFLQIGNTASSQARTVTLLLVAQRRDAPGKFMYVMGYKAHLKSALQWQVQRGKEMQIKLKFGLLADPTRVSKDYTAQVVRGI